MLLCLSSVLGPREMARVRETINGTRWIDGRATAGAQSALAKQNQQTPEEDPATLAAGEIILQALAGHAAFLSAALPLRIFPPLFSRYRSGDAFGAHVDNAIRAVRGGPVRVRTDLAMTLFLAAPDEYEGGELVIETRFGAQEVKLPAGDAVLYPASSLHRVAPVTRGVREASFLWLQSMVRDDGELELLFDLDQSIQRLAQERGQGDGEVVRLTGVYHNLVRRWANT